MNPFLTTTIIVAWLIALFFAWAFVHGAQLLRRQEVVELIAAQASESEETGVVTSIATEPAHIPYAA